VSKGDRWLVGRRGPALAVVLLLAVAVVVVMSGCNRAFWDGVARGMASPPTQAPATPAAAAGHTCPSCRSSMYFTGQTTVEWGKLLKLYQCPVGHSYWYPSTGAAAAPRSVTSAGDTCPICGMGVYFTGQTRVEWGKLQKIYRCPVGHESVR